MKFIVARTVEPRAGHIAGSVEYVDGISAGANEAIKVHYGASAAAAFRFDKRSTAARVVQAITAPGLFVGMLAVDE